jgi:hypothetical protein
MYEQNTNADTARRAREAGERRQAETPPTTEPLQRTREREAMLRALAAATMGAAAHDFAEAVSKRARIAEATEQHGLAAVLLVLQREVTREAGTLGEPTFDAALVLESIRALQGVDGIARVDTSKVDVAVEAPPAPVDASAVMASWFDAWATSIGLELPELETFNGPAFDDAERRRLGDAERRVDAAARANLYDAVNRDRNAALAEAERAAIRTELAGVRARRIAGEQSVVQTYRRRREALRLGVLAVIDRALSRLPHGLARFSLREFRRHLAGETPKLPYTFDVQRAPACWDWAVAAGVRLDLSTIKEH